ncbi:hypothetical protein HOY80DRAFT_1004668 [Tuber brumale]|nr:hypothetical protein HOY80DRAFT_1004668 [Tuber brumale]
MSTEKSFFEQQRDQLISEIALSLEHVLMNMNLLNRSLEGVVAVSSPPPSSTLLGRYDERAVRNAFADVDFVWLVRWTFAGSMALTLGGEFESVEALWSQFEGVMGKNSDEAKAEGVGEGDDTRMGG